MAYGHKNSSPIIIGGSIIVVVAILLLLVSHAPSVKTENVIANPISETGSSHIFEPKYQEHFNFYELKPGEFVSMRDHRQLIGGAFLIENLPVTVNHAESETTINFLRVEETDGKRYLIYKITNLGEGIYGGNIQFSFIRTHTETAGAGQQWGPAGGENSVELPEGTKQINFKVVYTILN